VSAAAGVTPPAAVPATAVGLPSDALRLRAEMRLLASRLQEMTTMCARLQQVDGKQGAILGGA
jgi:hypothetical protein